jgi:hypothetical protein
MRPSRTRGDLRGADYHELAAILSCCIAHKQRAHGGDQGENQMRA